MDFKLTIDLVPSTAWFKSLFNLLGTNEWNKIKAQVYKKEGRKCYICGAEKGKGTLRTLYLHEYWEYDEETGVQRLVEFHHLCWWCHAIKHIGYWTSTPDGINKMKKMNISDEDLINHFCKVNDCEREDFIRYKKEAFEIFRRRSMINWKQDFDQYNKLINQQK